MPGVGAEPASVIRENASSLMILRLRREGSRAWPVSGVRVQEQGPGHGGAAAVSQSLSDDLVQALRAADHLGFVQRFRSAAAAAAAPGAARRLRVLHHLVELDPRTPDDEAQQTDGDHQLKVRQRNHQMYINIK